MQIEPGYYYFRAVATSVEDGSTVVRQSGLFWSADADILAEHKRDYIKALIEEGHKEIKITHINKEVAPPHLTFEVI